MPRAKSNQSKLIDQNQQDPTAIVKRPYAVADNAEWGGFLNLRLSDDDSDAFWEWMRSPTAEEHWQLFDDAVTNGIKFSLSFDAEHTSWIATFTGGLLRDGKRYAMTSRAGTWQEATMLQTYKHAIILKGDYSPTRSEKNGWLRFG